MNLTPPEIDWALLTPQLILTGGALVMLVLPLLGRVFWPLLPALTVGVLGAAGVAAWSQWSRDGGTTFSDMITGDRLSLFGILIFVLSAGLTVLQSIGARDTARSGPDYYPLLLFATAGMAFMAASTDLVTFLLSLEILSISLYVLMALNRLRPEATEAAMKYFLLGAFATAFAVYGTALVYGGSGTTNLLRLANEASGLGGGGSLLVLAGLGLLTVGLGFKISMAPFHAWTPDVYQGAATPLTAFLSTGSKAAVFVVMIRVFAQSFENFRVDWLAVLGGLAVVTMVIGNATALRQSDVKRLLAYSSIAHVGYLLVGIASGLPDGGAGVLFYLTGYTAMNLTAFGVVIWMEREEGGAVSVSDFSGLGQRHPVLAAAMTVALFSLAGIPPTVGFVGKFVLFRAAVDSGLTGLAVLGVLNSAVSLFYYLRIVVGMYMRPSEEAHPAGRGNWAGAVALALSVLLILALGVFPNPVLRLAQAAAGLVP